MGNFGHILKTRVQKTVINFDVIILSKFRVTCKKKFRPKFGCNFSTAFFFSHNGFREFTAVHSVHFILYRLCTFL